MMTNRVKEQIHFLRTKGLTICGLSPVAEEAEENPPNKK
jgi:hypothetical protein